MRTGRPSCRVYTHTGGTGGALKEAWCVTYTLNINVKVKGYSLPVQVHESVPRYSKYMKQSRSPPIPRYLYTVVLVEEFTHPGVS